MRHLDVDTTVPFHQGLTPGQPWIMVEGSIRHGQIVYRNSSTGDLRRVANHPYNQPPAWRVEAYVFYADQAAEARRRHLEGNDQFRADEAARLERTCRELSAHWQAAHARGDYPRDDRETA